MYKHKSKIRVRYSETDQMGYVYYGNYAAYFEVARVEALRALGLSYRELEASGVMMPVIENYSKYHGPALYDELLTINVEIREKPKVRIAFNYEIFNEQDKLIHSGETKLVFANKETGKPCRMPQAMDKLLDPFFNE